MSTSAAVQMNGALSLQVSDAAGTSSVSTVNPAALHDGDNALPGGGTAHVDSATGIVTADVVGVNGSLYHLIATPNADGTATLEIVGSNGTDLIQRIASPDEEPTSQARRAATRGAKLNCKGVKDFAGYTAATSGIAAGVAVVAAGVGAEPVAAVAGGVSGVLIGLSGAAWLLGWASGCEM